MTGIRSAASPSSSKSSFSSSSSDDELYLCKSSARPCNIRVSPKGSSISNKRKEVDAESISPNSSTHKPTPTIATTTATSSQAVRRRSVTKLLPELFLHNNSNKKKYNKQQQDYISSSNHSCKSNRSRNSSTHAGFHESFGSLALSSDDECDAGDLDESLKGLFHGRFGNDRNINNIKTTNILQMTEELNSSSGSLLGNGVRKVKKQLSKAGKKLASMTTNNSTNSTRRKLNSSKICRSPKSMNDEQSVTTVAEPEDQPKELTVSQPPPNGDVTVSVADRATTKTTTSSVRITEKSPEPSTSRPGVRPLKTLLSLPRKERNSGSQLTAVLEASLEEHDKIPTTLSPTNTTSFINKIDVVPIKDDDVSSSHSSNTVPMGSAARQGCNIRERRPSKSPTRRRPTTRLHGVADLSPPRHPSNPRLLVISQKTATIAPLSDHSSTMAINSGASGLVGHPSEHSTSIKTSSLRSSFTSLPSFSTGSSHSIASFISHGSLVSMPSLATIQADDADASSTQQSSVQSREKHMQSMESISMASTMSLASVGSMPSLATIQVDDLSVHQSGRISLASIASMPSVSTIRTDDSSAQQQTERSSRELFLEQFAAYTISTSEMASSDSLPEYSSAVQTILSPDVLPLCSLDTTARRGTKLMLPFCPDASKQGVEHDILSPVFYQEKKTRKTWDEMGHSKETDSSPVTMMNKRHLKEDSTAADGNKSSSDAKDFPPISPRRGDSTALKKMSPGDIDHHKGQEELARHFASNFSSPEGKILEDGMPSTGHDFASDDEIVPENVADVDRRRPPVIEDEELDTPVSRNSKKLSAPPIHDRSQYQNSPDTTPRPALRKNSDF